MSRTGLFASLSAVVLVAALVFLILQLEAHVTNSAQLIDKQDATIDKLMSEVVELREQAELSCSQCIVEPQTFYLLRGHDEAWVRCDVMQTDDGEPVAVLHADEIGAGVVPSWR